MTGSPSWSAPRRKRWRRPRTARDAPRRRRRSATSSRRRSHSSVRERRNSRRRPPRRPSSYVRSRPRRPIRHGGAPKTGTRGGRGRRGSGRLAARQGVREIDEEADLEPDPDRAFDPEPDPAFEPIPAFRAMAPSQSDRNGTSEQNGEGHEGDKSLRFRLAQSAARKKGLGDLEPPSS